MLLCEIHYAAYLLMRGITMMLEVPVPAAVGASGAEVEVPAVPAVRFTVPLFTIAGAQASK
jgi:hypothetical protein